MSPVGQEKQHLQFTYHLNNKNNHHNEDKFISGLRRKIYE